MKEISISFMPEMARAILRDVDPKTETRRVITHFDRSTYALEPERVGLSKFIAGRWHLYPAGEGASALPLHSLRCPYGESGDRLRLITTWAVSSEFDDCKPTDLTAAPNLIDLWHAGMSEPKPEWAGKLRPGRFMPLALRSRMPLLKNDGVRVERLQEITEAGAWAEGIESEALDQSVSTRNYLVKDGWFNNWGVESAPDFLYTPTDQLARSSYRTLWDSINGKRGWGWFVDPLVFAVRFRREDP